MAVSRKPVFEERNASNSRDEPDNVASVEQEENPITTFKQITLRPSTDLKTAKVDIERSPVPAPVAVDQVRRQPAFSPSAGAGYRVQVGAYRYESNAVRGKDILTRMAPELLDRLETMVKTSNSTSSKAVNYRLRTVSLSQTDADNLCDNLKSKSIECLVIQHNDRLWSSA